MVGAGGYCLGVALVLGLIGWGEPMLGPQTVAIVIGISAAGMAFMYWTGYVPIIMTPPGTVQRLSRDEAARRIDPDEAVLGLTIDGEACAYLRGQIARPHYLPDRVGGRDVVVSYCILCNSATAFEARLNGQPLDLRCVTAYNNNIIYRDRRTGNVIQQLDARVIAGPDTGAQLNTLPVTVTRWADWVALHPDTEVLDAPPQSLRDRMIATMLDWLIPLHKLAQRDSPWHRVRGRIDGRVGAMQFVIGVEHDGEAVAYEVERLRQQTLIEDTVGATPIALFGTRDGAVIGVFDRRIGERTLRFEVLTDDVHPAAVVRDHDTDSLWSAAGRALSGPLEGTQLVAIPHFNRLFWFSWNLFKPTARLHNTASPSP